MRTVRCYECKRKYDYDEDGFCPHCGAFNQPAQSARINAAGEVVWADGINEANHANSFTHKELHAEDRERKRMGLEREERAPWADAVETLGKQAQKAFSKGSKAVGKKPRSKVVSIFIWIFVAYILMGLAVNLLYFLF